jgi:hypothetical protein
MLTNDLDVAGQVYQLNSEQRAAMAAAQGKQLQIAQSQEAKRNAAIAASMEAADKKRELEAQSLREQMLKQQKAQAAAEQAKAAQTVVHQAQPESKKGKR